MQYDNYADRRITELDRFSYKLSQQRLEKNSSRSRLSSPPCYITKRTIELLFVIPLVILVVIPLTLCFALSSFLTGKQLFQNNQITGQNGAKIKSRHFNTRFYSLARTALLYDVLSGKLALVGRSVSSSPEIAAHPANGYLLTSKPGVFTLFDIRKNTGISHEGRAACDWEYHFSQSPKKDIGLLFRSLLSKLYSTTGTTFSEKLNFIGITVVNTSMQDAMARIEQKLDKSTQPTPIFFVNPDCLNKSVSDTSYREILQEADIVLPDGIGLVIGANILGSPLKENINGTDMFPFLCELATKKKSSFFLLGGKPGVAESMKQNIEQRFGVRVADLHHGYFDRENESETVIRKINDSGADILLVAFGAPLQEKWISTHLHRLQVSITMGVGGLFDFNSGNIPRAPRWLRELGLEWVYRIVQEPGRMWRRYVIGNPLFLMRIFLQKIRKTNEQV